MLTRGQSPGGSTSFRQKLPAASLRASGTNSNTLPHVIAAALFLVSSAGASEAAPSYPSDPPGTPHEFICAWRGFAAEAVAALRPDAAAEAASALQLDSLCGAVAPARAAPVPAPAPASAPAAATELWVDKLGSDSNPGTPTAPLATVGAALALSRGAPRPASIFVRAGTYHLAAPLALDGADSGLAISAAPGDAGAVWLSGAVTLPPLAWAPYALRNASTEVFAATNAARGCNASAPADDPVCSCAAAPSAPVCEARFAAAANATAFIWHDAAQGPEWGLKCCLRHDGVWAPYPEAGHTSGLRSPALNVWVTDVPAALLPAGVPELRVNGARASRARYPNANPETQQFPIGWVLAGGQTWHPPNASAPAHEVQVYNDAIALRNSSENKNYSGAIGGPCVNFDPPFSYWCSAHPAGGGGFQYYVPSGMSVAPGVLPPFESPEANPPILCVSGGWDKGSRLLRLFFIPPPSLFPSPQARLARCSLGELAVCDIALEQ